MALEITKAQEALLLVVTITVLHHVVTTTIAHLVAMTLQEVLRREVTNHHVVTTHHVQTALQEIMSLHARIHQVLVEDSLAEAEEVEEAAEAEAVVVDNV